MQLRREEPTELEKRIQKALQFIVEQRQQTALKRQNDSASSPKAKAAPSECVRFVAQRPGPQHLVIFTQRPIGPRYFEVSRHSSCIFIDQGRL